MSDDAHVCGVFALPKQPGRCLCCQRDAYQVLATGPDGTPTRIGRMLPEGVQVEFLMSDGTESDLTFCVDCARNLRPADYARVWERVLDVTDAAVTRANRRPLERRLLLRQYTRIFPLAILRWRRESAELNRLVVDPRRTEVVHG